MAVTEKGPQKLLEQFRALHERHDERLATRVAELKAEFKLTSGVLDIVGQPEYETQFRAYIEKMAPLCIGQTHRISCVTRLFINASAAVIGEELADKRWEVTTTTLVVPRYVEEPWVLSPEAWGAAKDLVDQVNELVNGELPAVESE